MSLSKLIVDFLRYIAIGVRSKKEIGLKNERSTDVSYDDEQLFKILSQFVWIQGEPLPLIFDLHDEVYQRQGLTLAGLKRLADLGLIQFDSHGFVKKGFGQHTRLFYCGKPTKIGFSNDANNSLDLGHVLFTEHGKQFFSTIAVFKNQQFYEYVIRRWFQQGLSLSSIQIDRN